MRHQPNTLSPIPARACAANMMLLLAAVAPVAAQDIRSPELPRPASPAPAVQRVTPVWPDSTPLPGPPVRRIETASALSKSQLGAITSIRQLSDGRILLSDGTRRRLLMLDSTLAEVAVLLDSLTEVHNAYGTRPGTLIPYRGDTTLFIDASTFAMLVIDPAGQVVRIRSVPRADEASNLLATSSNNGFPSFDSRGRLVYRMAARSAPPAAARAGVPVIPQIPDSAFVVSVDLESRHVDTLGVVRTPRSTFVVRGTQGGFSISSYFNPMHVVDDWSVLSDGTVAFLRGRDYRLEFRDTSGTYKSSDKLPFPWVRITDDDREKMADSIREAMTASSLNGFTTQMIAWSNLLNKPYPANFNAHSSYRLPSGIPRDWILPKGVQFPPNYRYGCPPGVKSTASSATPMTMMMGAPVPPPSPGAAAGSDTSCVPNPYAEFFGNGYTPPAPVYRPPVTVPAKELPDYRPPFGVSAMRADADNNLWIRTAPMRGAPGAAVYDIVDRSGQLVDRIQLPPGYALVGFGPGRIVYLSVRNQTGLHLARVRLR